MQLFNTFSNYLTCLENIISMSTLGKRNNSSKYFLFEPNKLKGILPKNTNPAKQFQLTPILNGSQLELLHRIGIFR